MRRAPRWFLLLLMACSLAFHASGQTDGGTYADVQAIFDARCTMCHGGAQPSRGLGLDGFERLMSGSETGPVVVPGDPDASELVRRIRGTSTPRMPLTGPPYLSDAEIETIVGWIAAGAPGPADGAGDGDANADGEGAPEVGAAPGAATDPEPGTYAHVRTILLRRCASCHSEGGVMGRPPEGLRLTSWDDVLNGGERVVVVPGSPEASELVRRVEGSSLPQMPLDGPPYLDPEQIESIRLWIERGAPDPDGEAAPMPVGAEVRYEGTLTARWEIDGLPLVVTGDTRIDDAPDVGARVEVRGVVTTEGGVRATRIRAR